MMTFFRYFPLLFICTQCLVLQAQEQPKVDFLEANAALSPNAATKVINGTVSYTFTTLAKIDSVFLDAKHMTFTKVLLNNRSVKHTVDTDRITLFKKLKEGKKYKLELTYTTQPKQTLYFFGWTKEDATNNQIWTQGQGKYTSHWLPSFDDMNEKVVFNLDITFHEEYQVIANGKLKNTSTNDGLKKWQYTMSNPMSSYLLAFAIGKYSVKKQVSNSGIPIELYYYPKDSAKVETTYRYSNEIFNFLEKEIGVPYPWQVYKQIPVRDFLYAGMENTTTTIFSDAYVVDSIAYNDTNYVNINAHELAHQWFGDLVTEVSSNHHWLHEGFATYYAYLAQKEVLGEDYFNWKLFSTALQLDKYSQNNKGESLIDPKASSLTFYEKGAWALHALVHKVGKEAFKDGVQKYLEKHKYKNVTVTDFLKSIEETSGADLSDYKKTWLEATDFPTDKAKAILKKTSPSLASFYRLQKELSVSKKTNSLIIDKYWEQTTSTELKNNIIEFYSKFLSKEVKDDILKSNNVMLRKTLVLNTPKILGEDVYFFESFLTDKSYTTIENTLYKLWIYNPEKRADYLDKTKGVIGFSSKNVRQLWLALAIMTKGYHVDVKQEYLKELRSYTREAEYFETRQLAFSYLNDLFYLDDANLKDLIHATNHPVWQFKKFARNLVEDLLEKKEYKKKLEELEAQVSTTDFKYIKSKL
ncbi:M1 family metallopeptidase [Cellulophaga sp. 20_2_10]|uniref:M1 family metallopeptidase n=1 Tax=Cellulophaga sp. 20_2_10 TaxID=2942476 RepID=UPI00201AC4B7|nr:M1 family metallopeptidase [Cellulophaga sp. 20_2_10]MCL5244658.1 M1 family metallopeptidase [Cellulophaga sp. 20_2_10]